MPLDPTLNSSTYGASVNLKTILDKSRNKVKFATYNYRGKCVCLVASFYKKKAMKAL